MQSSSECDPVSRARVLIISDNKAFIEIAERYLILAGVARVFVAQNALLGLRILQDHKANIGCVLWSAPAGVEFLVNLRSGRWGGGLKRQRFILYLPTRDVTTIRKAVSLAVNAVVVGMPDREEFSNGVRRAIASEVPHVPLEVFQAAHLNYRGMEALFVPLPDGFEVSSDRYQTELAAGLAEAAFEIQIACPLVMIWRSRDGASHVRASAELLSFLKDLSIEFITSNLNRYLLVDKPEKTGKSQPGPELDEATPRPLENDKWGDGEERSPAMTKSAIGVRFTHTKVMPTDIARLVAGFKKMGSRQFFDKYCFSQNAVTITADGAFAHTGKEFFTNLSGLSSDFFPQTDARKVVNREHELLATLDSLFLQSFHPENHPEVQLSINLRVHTLSTPIFASFLERVNPRGLTIEVTQADIVSNFEDFNVVREKLLRLGVRFGVDNIAPGALGLVNLDMAGINEAKVSWSQDLKEHLKNRPTILNRFMGAGIQVVLGRVDDPEAIQFGTAHGITQFQGFFIDEQYRARM